MATPSKSWLNLLFRVSGRLPLWVIARHEENPEPYLERYSLLRSRWLTIYLHRFVGRDQGLELHDHPWSALSLVLAGKYRERRLTKKLEVVERNVRWWNLVRANKFHMIVEAAPETWTLFIHGPKRKRWGFLGPVVEGQASYKLAPEANPNWHRSAERPERMPLNADAAGWFVQTNSEG